MSDQIRNGKTSIIRGLLNKNRQHTTRYDEGVSLSDSPPPAPPVDMSDSALYEKDFDMHFAKSTFNHYLDLAVLEGFYGYAIINPKHVLEHIDNHYKDEPSGAGVPRSSNSFPGHTISNRIKAARATGCRKTLETFLAGLKERIVSHCEMIRKEQCAELDANPESSPRRASCSEDQHSGRSSAQFLSAENTAEPSTGSPVETDPASTTEANERPGDSSTSSTPSFVEDPEEIPEIDTEYRRSAPARETSGTEEPPLHVYSSMLHSHAIDTRELLRVVPAGSISLDGWSCTIIYGNIARTGIAGKKKDAGHIAARLVCQELGIAA